MNKYEPLKNALTLCETNYSCHKHWNCNQNGKIRYLQTFSKATNTNTHFLKRKNVVIIINNEQ